MADDSVGKITLDELAQYTGEGGSRILMSISRTVYDVTSGADFCKRMRMRRIKSLRSPEDQA